jgi:hypothetical protein
MISRAIILELEKDAGKGKRKLELLVARLVDAGIAGDIAACREVIDRVEGKPLSSLEVSGKDGGPIPFKQITPEMSLREARQILKGHLDFQFPDDDDDLIDVTPVEHPALPSPPRKQSIPRLKLRRSKPAEEPAVEEVEEDEPERSYRDWSPSLRARMTMGPHGDRYRLKR